MEYNHSIPVIDRDEFLGVLSRRGRAIVGSWPASRREKFLELFRDQRALGSTALGAVIRSWEMSRDDA